MAAAENTRNIVFHLYAKGFEYEKTIVFVYFFDGTGSELC